MRISNTVDSELIPNSADATGLTDAKASATRVLAIMFEEVNALMKCSDGVTRATALTFLAIAVLTAARAIIKLAQRYPESGQKQLGEDETATEILHQTHGSMREASEPKVQAPDADCIETDQIKDDTNALTDLVWDRQLRLTQGVIAQIRSSIGSERAETGGMLGGDPLTGLVTHFHYDGSSHRTRVTYSPDVEKMNRVLEDWNPKGIRLLGFVHSHPPGFRQPSTGDLEYARRFFEVNKQLKRFLLPIVMAEPDNGRFEILPYAVFRSGDTARLETIHLETISCSLELESVRETEATMVASGRSLSFDDRLPVGIRVWPVEPALVHPETFKRVTSAYDLDHLSKCRVIYVGAGGAAGFVEDLARAGVGEHVLIDPDTVSATNLATQQTYLRDLGRPKVDCIAERILQINPAARVITCQLPLDGIDDELLEWLGCGTIGENETKLPATTLLCGLTDNFEAQARVNRLAIKLELPSLCAQVYRQGRGAEVTFTHPDTTPACHRCVLASRYRHYTEHGFQNDVTSDGTPIFATTRLNALKGFVALALLHWSATRLVSPNAMRWTKLLEKIGNRNLIQIRLDPDISETLGLKVFDRVFAGADGTRILFDDVVWLPQKPDSPRTNGNPTCPDCGGTGNLRQAAGRIGRTTNGR